MLISALMTVYNGEDYICDTIQSVLNQTYRDFELIIVDDGSTDQTVRIIKSCFRDPRIKIVQLQSNQGVGAALNHGLQHISGKYTVKIDADDISHERRFEYQKEYLDNHPNISLVKSLVRYFPDNRFVAESQRYLSKLEFGEKHINAVMTPEEISEKLYWFCCILHSSIMVRSSILKEFGYRNIRCGEDYDLFYRMNEAGYKMGGIGQPLVKVRISESSVTAQTNSLKDFVTLCLLLKKDYLDSMVQNTKEIYIWGSGNLGGILHESLLNKGITVRGFIDSDLTKAGKEKNGIKIISPIEMDWRPDIKVIVASQPGRFQIDKSLKNKGYKHLKDYIILC